LVTFQYFVLLGGRGDDSPNGIVVDAIGRAYVTGSTASTDFPTRGALQSSNAGGASIMLGASPWVIPPSWHLPVIEFRDQLSPRRLMTLADLSKFAIDVRRFYHQIVDAIVNPRLPTLENTDGDPIEMTTMIYDLGLTPAESFDRLRQVAKFNKKFAVPG
jgi:hypothetical protein